MFHVDWGRPRVDGKSGRCGETVSCGEGPRRDGQVSSPKLCIDRAGLGTGRRCPWDQRDRGFYGWDQGRLVPPVPGRGKDPG